MTESLVAHLISKVNTVKSPGKKAFQKIAYFVQENGVPLGLNYGIHLYGPYSPVLAYTLQSFEMDGIVSIQYDGRSALIKPGGSMEMYLNESQVEEVAREWSERINYVIDNLADEPPLKLELLSTTHFLAKERLKYESELTEDSLISDVIELKQDKFTAAEIIDAIARLRELRFLN